MAPTEAPPVVEAEAIIQTLIEKDKVKWWSKPNLRRLYLLLVPFCFCK